MRVKNLRGGQWGPILKKLDSFTLETSKNHLNHNFLHKGRLRVKPSIFLQSVNEDFWQYPYLAALRIFERKRERMRVKYYQNDFTLSLL